MSELNLTAANFQEQVLQSEMPVLVDFWATWCAPCRMLAPTIAELARERAGSLKVGKVNVDEEPELAARYGISSIPTVMLFEQGRLKGTLVGYRPKAAFEELLK